MNYCIKAFFFRKELFYGKRSERKGVRRWNLSDKKWRDLLNEMVNE